MTGMQNTDKNSSNTRSRSSAGSFVVQGALLAAASIVVRIIGMLYRVPLTAIIGTEGNGYYTSAFSIYTLLLILSSFSMPTAISKIVSGYLVEGQFRNIRRLMQTAFVYATAAGFIMFSVLWFGASAIALWLQKPFCVYALKALAPTVWIMAYLGLLRGYFQGSGNMVPTAVSQILEQIMNAVISVAAAHILFSQGEAANAVYGSSSYSYAYGAAGGCIGTGAGALTALMFFIILYLARRKTDRKMIQLDDNGTESTAAISMILASTMLPILISSTVYNISAVIDDYIFGNIMAYLHEKDRIVRYWGVFGEYHILFNIPVALANALSASLIPALTRAVKAEDRRETVSRLRYAIRFTMLIAIPASAGLCVLADPIARLLFPGEDVLLLIHLTEVGSAAVVLFSLSTITNAILQGLGRLNAPLGNALLSLVIHVAALVLMLFAGLEIYAVVLSNIVFAFCMCLFNHLSIKRVIAFREDIMLTYIKPLIACMFMCIAAYMVYYISGGADFGIYENSRIEYAVRIVPSILAAVFVYMQTLILLRGFTKDDLEQMPFGRKLKHFVKI